MIDPLNEEVIYEKKYPRTDPMEEWVMEMANKADKSQKPRQSFDEFLKQIYENTTYIPLPERIKAGEEFIRAAIDLCELYELNTIISRYYDHITVKYSFDCGGGMREMNRVFGMADRFSFFQNIFDRDITISLEFYTHRVIRNGRILAP